MLPLSSPLLLLQVSKLQSLGLAAEHLAGDNRARHSGVMVRLRRDPPQLTLLYLMPEKVVSSCSFLPPAPQIVSVGQGLGRPAHPLEEAPGPAEGGEGEGGGQEEHRGGE